MVVIGEYPTIPICKARPVFELVCYFSLLSFFLALFAFFFITENPDLSLAPTSRPLSNHRVIYISHTNTFSPGYSAQWDDYIEPPPPETFGPQTVLRETVIKTHLNESTRIIDICALKISIVSTFLRLIEPAEICSFLVVHHSRQIPVPASMIRVLPVI